MLAKFPYQFSFVEKSFIDKLAWVCNKDRKTLYVRSKGKELFFNPGGKREGDETDSEALTREIKEELNIELVPDTIKYLETFMAQAAGKPEGVMVQIKCYAADSLGAPTPTSEIEELAWFTSADMHRTSATGQLILQWLKGQNLID
jgi:ADP-ribose pyrophosphatase YjhB (NUDIX family)